MILSHESLNNLDVVIILLRIKTAYVCKLVRSSQSFFHFFVRSFSVRSFFVRSFFLCSFVLARSLFVHSLSVVSSLCLFVARFKIKSKKDNKNVYLIQIKINNILLMSCFQNLFRMKWQNEFVFRNCLFKKNSDCFFESIQRELRNCVVIYSWSDRIRAFAISKRA
jgi:hypothetical protein